MHMEVLQKMSVPANLSSLVGSVDYYKERARDFELRHPDGSAPDYYLGYGDRYMHRFVDELGPAMSGPGKKWLLDTRASLQAAIENARAHDPEAFDRLEQDPERFRNFCLETHPSAYVNSGLGRLSPREWVQVILTPDSADLLNRKGVAQMIETVHLLAEQRAHQDLEKVRQHWPGLAQALEATGKTCQPLVARAAQDLNRLARPLSPCLESVAKVSESAVLACCPLFNPIRQGLWTTVNSLAMSR